MVSDVAAFAGRAGDGGMAAWQLPWPGRFRLLAGSCRCTVDAGYLRPQDHSPVAQAVGRRRAKAWRSNFRRRKNHLACGHRRPDAGADSPVQRNGEMGLDGSCVLFAVVILVRRPHFAFPQRLEQNQSCCIPLCIRARLQPCRKGLTKRAALAAGIHQPYFCSKAEVRRNSQMRC